LLAYGTATLECLLLVRAMVVAYRTTRVTAWLARRLIKITHVSQPNILCQAPLVPELLGDQATPERLGQEVYALLRHPVLRELQVERFEAVHRALKCDAGARAAAAIGSLLAR